MLVTMLQPSSQSVMRSFPQSVVVFLDIPSHCRRIVLRCIRTHDSSLHFLRCFTCIPSLHCFVSTVLLVLVFLLLLLLLLLVIGRLHHWCFLFASPSRFASLPLTSRPIRAACQYLLVCLCLPIVSPGFPSPCEGLRISSPRIYIIRSPRHFIVKSTHFPIARTPFPSPYMM